MLRLTEIRERMELLNLSALAEKTGINYQTLLRIKKGENVRYDVVEALSDYLESISQKEA